MLRTVKAAHSALVLYPDTQVLEFGIYRRSSRKYLGQMAPVHTKILDGALPAVCSHAAESVGQKLCEFPWAHFAGRHREFTVFDRTLAAGMAVYFDVIGRITENNRGQPSLH